MANFRAVLTRGGLALLLLGGCVPMVLVPRPRPLPPEVVSARRLVLVEVTGLPGTAFEVTRRLSQAVGFDGHFQLTDLTGRGLRLLDDAGRVAASWTAARVAAPADLYLSVRVDRFWTQQNLVALQPGSEAVGEAVVRITCVDAMGRAVLSREFRGQAQLQPVGPTRRRSYMPYPLGATDLAGEALGAALAKAVEELQPGDITDRLPLEDSPALEAGLALFREGNLPAARKVWAQVLAANPGDGQAAWNLAVLADAAGEVEEARAGYRRAAASLPLRERFVEGERAFLESHPPLPPPPPPPPLLAPPPDAPVPAL